MDTKVAVTSILVALATLAGSAAAQQPTDVAQLYARTCASCHGANGTPSPQMVQAMGAIPDFADRRAIAARPDSVLRAVITSGKGRLMPAYRTRLTPEQIQALVGYIRTLSRRP